MNGAGELRIPAEVDRLPEVLAFLEQELEAAACPMKAQMQLSVAVEEIFVNIASYAYAPDHGMAELQVALLKDPRRVSVTFRDSGRPFDPVKQQEPDLTLPAEEREIGGLGIYMTKKAVDEMVYEHREGQNVLTLIKRC